jgi:hypothetical protein
MVMVDPELLNYAQLTDAVSSKRLAFYTENIVYLEDGAATGALTTASPCPTMQ